MQTLHLALVMTCAVTLTACSADRGADGKTGDAGAVGANGREGMTGADGKVGDTGAQGTEGPPGAPGQDGNDGDDGDAGADGTDCTVDTDAVTGVATVSCADGTQEVLNDLDGDGILDSLDRCPHDAICGASLDLSGVDLSDADLRFADLAGADLSGANLTGANLQSADLRGADLTGITAPDLVACPTALPLFWGCFPQTISGYEIIRYHKVFVTSALYKGNLGGLSGGDDKCAAVAETAELPGTWTAILSDPGADALGRLTIVGPVYNFDPAFNLGARVADDASDFWDGTLAAPILYDQHEVAVSAVNPVFTGTHQSGVLPGAAHCLGWTDASGGQTGWAGYPDRTDYGWTIATHTVMNYTSSACNVDSRLYCFSQF
jgi:hypothetical protein